MPHDVPERTDHTAFLGLHAEKDAHPARAGAAILASVLPHAPHPAEGPKTECLPPGLSPKTLGFKVLKAHLSVHICLLDMLECVDVAIPYPEGR